MTIESLPAIWQERVAHLKDVGLNDAANATDRCLFDLEQALGAKQVADGCEDCARLIDDADRNYWETD